ncbi:phosphatase PAP2 family protein [Vineibacter terrae]|uniref:phosphatase PAP2 family protein n=1 Tax=Vineibacter terrae TaxID=2586908 RepID=UPI002E33E793|nr:phosphatase PAP2 family protein [Vineibacter terrae]HEX2885568.1 phosphatase PAP2 family protein [Vineibacter terrae]
MRRSRIVARTAMPSFVQGTSADQVQARSAHRQDSARQERRSAAVVWLMIGGIGVLDVAGLVVTGVRMAPGSLLLYLSVPLGLLGIAAFYRASGRSRRIAGTLAAVAQLFALGVVGSIASYLLIRIERPFVDDALVWLDTMAGLDWPAYCRFIQTLGIWPNRGLELLYASSVVQIMAVAMLLGFTARSARLAELVGCFVVTAGGVVVVGALLPALGAHHAYGIADGGEAAFVPEIIAAHGGRVDPLDMVRMTGLVTFPSFHTVISLLLIVATWGIRWVGPVVILVNAALLAGVPVYGSHHFVDMLGGAALTALAVWLWRRLFVAPRRHPCTE